MARRDHRWVRQQLREILLDEIRSQAVRILLVSLILENADREDDAFLRVVHVDGGNEASLADEQTVATAGYTLVGERGAPLRKPRRRGRPDLSRSRRSSAENEAGIKRSGPPNQVVTRGYDQSYSRFFSINPMDGKGQGRGSRRGWPSRGGLVCPRLFRFKGN
jgi:hypothetical protein